MSERLYKLAAEAARKSDAAHWPEAVVIAICNALFSEEAIERASEKLGMGYPKAVVRAVVAALRGDT
jgi:hypothetical protein